MRVDWLLCLLQHEALLEGRETPMTRALDFLHRAYRPTFWYFESIHICRKLFLVGFAVFLPPGSLVQVPHHMRMRMRP